MSGDDLTISLFFVSLAIPAFGLEAMKAETLPRRIVFGSISILCLLTGLFWIRIKTIWPPFTEAATTVATNPLSWFVVLMFFLAVVAFHRPKQRQSAPIQVKEAVSKDEPKEIPEEREFVNVSPEYLLGIRSQENLTRVQTDKILVPFYGKWLKVNGVITEIYETIVWLRIGDKSDGRRQHVMLFLNDAWKARFHVLELNKPASAIGKIRGVNNTEVELANCELADT